MVGVPPCSPNITGTVTDQSESGRCIEVKRVMEHLAAILEFENQTIRSHLYLQSDLAPPVHKFGLTLSSYELYSLNS